MGTNNIFNISSAHAPQKEVKYGYTNKVVFSVEKGGKVLDNLRPEPVFVNVYGAQESIPRNRFRRPM
jgi:hypothetical protein